MLKFKCVANLTYGEKRFSIRELYSKEDLKGVEDVFVKAHFVEVEVEEDAQSEEKTPDLSSLTVAEIKETLETLGVEIPEGVTKKADLIALLTDAQSEEK